MLNPSLGTLEERLARVKEILQEIKVDSESQPFYNKREIVIKVGSERNHSDIIEPGKEYNWVGLRFNGLVGKNSDDITYLCSAFNEFYNLKTETENDFMTDKSSSNIYWRLGLPDHKPKIIIGMIPSKEHISFAYEKGDAQSKQIIDEFIKMIKPLEILLIDDDNSVLRSSERIVELNLNSRKHIIDTASNGIEALEKIKAKGWYDLIITDYRMPGMNGIDFYKGLRSINPEQQKRVVMFSSDDPSSLKSMIDNSLSPEDHKPLPVFSKFEVFKEISEIVKTYLS